MKESGDSDLPPLTSPEGVTNPLRGTVTSPHIVERQCPYCESTSVVEKTSVSGSVPNYGGSSMWTDSVLMQTSPGHTKSPINSIANNVTPVMTQRTQKEYVVEINSSQQKEEREIPTPVFTSTTCTIENEVYQQNDDTIHMDVTEHNDDNLKSQKVNEKNDLPDVNMISTVEHKDNEEMALNKPSNEPSTLKYDNEPSNEPSNLKYDDAPDISFEMSFGSLPSKEYAFPQSKKSHNRSRSMDLQAKTLNPKRTTNSHYLTGSWQKGDDVSEISFAASLMEYATQKKLLKSSEVSLDSSVSGAATPSDSLLPARNTTQSSSDSRSITPADVPYSLDDPLYMHNSFKLYLDMKVFDDHEEFKLLLRVRCLVLYSHTL